MKQRIYKVSTFIIITVLIFNAVLLSVINISDALALNRQESAQKKVTRAVQASNLASAMKQCLQSETLVKEKEKFLFGSTNASYTTKNAIRKNGNNLFHHYNSTADTDEHGAVLPNPSASVGADVVAAVSGGKITGESIECGLGSTPNVTTLFGQFFLGENFSLDDLICDKTLGKNGNYGLLILKDYKTGSKSCEETLTDTYAKYVKNPNASAYIEKIYNSWSKKNEFAVNYEDVGKQFENKTLAYEDYLKVFKAECTAGNGSSYSDKDGEGFYAFTVKELQSDGVISLRHYSLIDEKKKDGSQYTTVYADGNRLTCAKLAEKINNSFDTYKKNINTVQDKIASKSPCSSKDIIDKATDIVTTYGRRLDAHAALTEEEKNEYEILSKALMDKNFTVDDGNGGKKCLETRKLKTCNSEKMRAKAQSIIDMYDDKVVNKAQALTEEESNESKFLNQALKNGDFTVDDGNGGKKCYESTNFNLSVSPEEEDVDDFDPAAQVEETAEQKQSYCQENGGFLSWMLCPAIADGAATAGGLLGSITALTTVHTSIIEQFSKQDSSIYKAWSAFRNVANIGFVIMLLVVVFSQVTNIGISNYNIKKILPKLIITAILVNFSYLIMGVLIDLSQIVGNGIGVLIRSVAADGMDSDASARASSTISAIALLVTSAAGGGAVVAGLLSGPAIILPVVMFIVTSLISVFFGFIMLTIRQAAIIMVVVLAPLAMVLYALPNTAVITKKYFTTVKALLMLYPMFIFATSAGALASSIIIGTSTDLLMMIVGGLLNVLPYFAIPSMTSKSLAGLGAITGAFDKIRGGALKGAGMAVGAFGASEFYKNMKSDFNSDKNLNRSLGRLRKYKAIEDAGGKLSISQRRRQMEAAGVVTKDAKMRAGGSTAAGIALSNYEGAGFAGLQAAAQNELMEAEDKNNMMLFADKGYTPDDMIGMLKDASAADYTKMTDTEKNANDSLIRSLTKSLMSTKAGKKAFESQIASSKDMRLSNRAFGQIAHAVLQTPGLADKYQVMNNQFSSYVNGGGDTSDTDVRSGLMGSTFSNGISKTLEDMNSDNLQKITKFEVDQMYKSGADTTNLDNAFNTLAAASLKDPNLIADFDGIKQEKVLAAQGKYIDEAQKSTINLRSGGSATVYNPPADFGKYTQIKDASGQIFYTNDRGDIFNASTGKQIKGM